MSTDTHVRGSVSEKHTKLPWLHVVFHAPLRLVKPSSLLPRLMATTKGFSSAPPARWIVSTLMAAAPTAQVGVRYLTERATSKGFSDVRPYARWILRPSVT